MSRQLLKQTIDGVDPRAIRNKITLGRNAALLDLSIVELLGKIVSTISSVMIGLAANYKRVEFRIQKDIWRSIHRRQQKRRAGPARTDDKKLRNHVFLC